ncbi:hypothetical protein OJAV_G00045120 [Oryzias javanicus]|uniref:Cytochrome c oxidase assembly protein COX14 homolog n=1 Tax=Oryzias javanicus TaxID=123683 RepID=A0A437DDJ7_ORYJA|nr:hypothetical protein OJAV_G00045120 [Oryzias javanicus]
MKGDSADCCDLLLYWIKYQRVTIIIMLTGKRLADIGYRAFSASMMLLTVYGGYLCSVRAYRYMQKQKQLKVAAENQDAEIIKD